MRADRRLVVALALGSMLTIAGCGDDEYEPAAADAAGVDATPVDGIAPEVGDSIGFSAVTATSLEVQWGAATDDVTGATELRYKVVRAASPDAIDTLAEVEAITGGAALVLDWTADSVTVDVDDLSPATTYAFAVVVEDAAGNQALYAPATVSTLDTSAPTPGTAISFSDVAATSVTVSWGAATDDVTVAAGLQYKVVRGATAASIDTLAEVAAITGGAALVLDLTADATTTPATGLVSSTTYAFAVMVEDAAGNQALYTPATVATLDVTDPTVTITSPTAAATLMTAAATIALGGTAADDLAVASVSWANTTNATSGAATGTTTWSIASVTLVAGDNTIVVTATDGAGNTATDTITVTRDNTDPTVTITSPTAAATFTTAAVMIALGGTASDNVDVASVSWANTTNATSGAATGTTTWTIAAVTLAAGPNTIVVTATDGAGNSMTDEVIVTRAGVVSVVAGGYHNCALFDDGRVKCWGYNDYGQLGLGDAAHRGDGAGEMGAALPAVDLGTGRTAVAVAAGNNHTCALLDDGSVKCWGFNWAGQLGLGDTANRGDGLAEMGDALLPVALGAGRTAVALTAGANQNCALLDDSSVKCWGHNAAGQLGLGNRQNRGDGADEMGDVLSVVDLGTGRTAVALTAGGQHTCARLDDSSVKCWGDNGVGELGLGDTVHRGDDPGEMGDTLPAVALGTGRTAVALTAGNAHTCARLDDSSIKCWGYNFIGQLGLGDTAYRGDGPGEMGDTLPAIPLGTGRTAVAPASGGFHTCALLDDGSVKCWGYNDYGQLGLGDTAARGDGPGEMSDELPAVAVGSGRTAVALTAGAVHTCALLDDGHVKCWGFNLYGLLGLGDTADRGDGPGEMGDALLAVEL